MDPLDLVLAGQQLLRQRWPRVGQVLLGAHHHQLAVEPGLARSLGASKSAQRCSDDDKPGYAHYRTSISVAKLKSVRYISDG
jgi:hypothetical protein